jgi:arabinan endo-1,5-alpha-L-arabinosidase
MLRHCLAYRCWSVLGALILALATITAPASQSSALAQSRSTATYTNPLPVAAPGIGNGTVETCADPSVIYGQQPGDNYWYMYCTTDPLNSEDRVADGGFNFRLMPMLRSRDLVSWEYVGDAFDRPGPDADPTRLMPEWVEPTAGLWAPEIEYFNGQYYLYYGATDVKDEISGAPGCPHDNAIGVATSSRPTGPWTDLGRPVVEPRYNGAPREFGERECNFFWTYDPEVFINEANLKYIYYGSYYGGIEVRQLSDDGFTAPANTAVQVAIPNRYEAPEVVHHNGYYYLFVSATDCCRGPLSGYSVFAGRSTSPLGPFVDREGVSFLRGRVGGTPVISMNGNRWVGPGHNTVFQDYEGQFWTAYHAIDRHDPYFEGAVGFTKRPVLIDPLDWVDGWPTVRVGLWASDSPQPAPAAQPGDRSNYRVQVARQDEVGNVKRDFSDEFEGDTLNPVWSWVRQPAAGTYGLEDGAFRFDTQAADLHVDSNNASVLTRPAPRGDYVVETKVQLDLPPEGCCHNFVQAGMVVYGDDDNYLKLVHVSIFETRQTEFAKEVAPVPEGFPRYGNTVVGPPSLTTWLRIVKRTRGGEEHYTAYTSRDGTSWVRGGTWTHNLGENARIGLVSMGGTGFTAHFDYVRVHDLMTHVYFPLVLHHRR